MLAMNIQSGYELHQAGRYADAARGYQAQIFKVDPGTIVTIDGLTIANGYAYDFFGGGIWNDHGTLTVNTAPFHESRRP